MSRVGKSGREMVTRSERMKAQKRMKMPGRKKARAAMTVVNEQEPWTTWLGECTLYAVPVVLLRRKPRACWGQLIHILRQPYVITQPCSTLKVTFEPTLPRLTP